MEKKLIDEERERTLRRMIEWYSTRPKGEIVTILYGSGKGEQIASSSHQWVEYLNIQSQRGWYSVITKEILNGLRSYWIRYRLTSSAKGIQT